MRKTKKLFFWILAISTFARVFLARIVPLTGDEAYFIIWAKHLNYGYYEHPPMIGWIMWFFSLFGNDIFIYRIFPIIVLPLISLFMVKLLMKIDEDKAYLCGSVFLLSPVSILNVLSVNDVPLIFFTFLSGFFLYRALGKNRVFDAILAGIFVGCAFLSKYFSVLFALAVLIFFVFLKKKEKWKILIIFFVASFPLVFINLLWNYNNCWLNIMFNLFFRNKNISFNFGSVFIYILEQIFLMTPFLAFVFIKKNFLWNEVKNNPGIQMFWYFFTLPLLFLFLLSFVKNIGLHWTVSFYPFFFILLIFLPTDILDRATRYNFYLSISMLIFITIIIFTPVELFKSWKKYPQIIMFMRPYQLCEKINEDLYRRIPASTGYTETSVLSYYCKKDFVLFGSMSRSGRYYDFITDFRNFDNKNFLIVSLNKSDFERIKSFFKNSEVQEVKIYDAKFYFIYGDSFIYNKYRDLYLKKILELYYSPPPFLPIKKNFFKERYF